MHFFQTNLPQEAVVLLDLNLPDIHGVDILKVIRQQSDDIPVVVLTTSNLEEEQEACHNLGISAFLEKPFNSDMLLSLMETVLIKN
ncbi:MAG: response regulator [Chloroflexota bacterium]